MSNLLLFRPSHWGGFIQKLQVLSANSSVLRTLKHITPEVLLQLTSDTRRLLTRECKTISREEFHAVLSSGSLLSSASQTHGASSSAFWLPIDLFLEDAMDGSEVAIISAVETLTSAGQFLCCIFPSYKLIRLYVDLS